MITKLIYTSNNNNNHSSNNNELLIMEKTVGFIRCFIFLTIFSLHFFLFFLDKITQGITKKKENKDDTLTNNN